MLRTVAKPWVAMSSLVAYLFLTIVQLAVVGNFHTLTSREKLGVAWYRNFW